MKFRQTISLNKSLMFRVQAWTSAEAYWRVYQDWRAWTQEGIIDIAAPMAYKGEHSTTIAPQYDQWNAWLRGHLYNRAGIMGQGGLSNGIEGTLRQTRRTLTPDGGTNLSGIIFYSMATSNIAVTNNPFAIPVPVTTPARLFPEFASGLVTGKSVNGVTLYEPAGQTPIFANVAPIPVLPWKSVPTVGHIKGFAKRADNTPLDTAVVTIKNIETNAVRTGATDGGGFYGGVDLAPGQYLVKAELGSATLYSCVANVTPGAVIDASVGVENTAPVTIASVSPALPNGTNGWYTVNVDLNLSASDGCSGVDRTEYSTDSGDTWLPYPGTITIDQEGVITILFRSIDRAGNVENARSTVVKIDKTAPAVQLTATPSVIWPPNGKPVNVAISGTGTDAVSGLAGVNYVVTDEYGTVLSIAPRTLSGNSSEWLENLIVEAARNGGDRDGRLYRITATITDAAGLTSSASTDIVVSHDRRR